MRGVQTLVIINQKGGVGKTTTVANLGAAVAAKGRRLCLIDMDPQAHLTLHLGLEPDASTPGIYHVLTGNGRLDDAAIELTENLSLVPSVVDLAAAETELVSVVGREQILLDRLDECDSSFDYVIVDCPPSLGLLTLNALAAADYVFIPLQAHFLALQGLGKLLETVALVQRRINPGLKVGGVILCMHERQTRLAGEVVDDLEEFLQSARDSDAPWADANVFSTAIRRNIKLAECPSHGKSIFEYDPGSNGAKDYESLAEEFMEFLTSHPPDPKSLASKRLNTPSKKTATVPTPQPEPQAAEPTDATPPPETAEPANESTGNFRRTPRTIPLPPTAHPYGATR